MSLNQAANGSALFDLENVAVGHPHIAEAAAIGVHHPKWDERPLLVVVPTANGQNLTKEDVLGYLEGKIAKWWMPDDVAFAEDLPHTATGKLSKLQLRQRFKTTSYQQLEPNML